MLAAGNRFKRPFTLVTEITNKFFAPVLSAQFITAATGRPSETRNLLPLEPPLPRFDILTQSSLTEGKSLLNWMENEEGV